MRRVLTQLQIDDYGRKLDRENAAWLAGMLAPLPPSFAALVEQGRNRRIAAKHGSAGLRDGNTWMRRQVGKLDRFAVDLAASDDEIRRFADECADDVRSFLSALTLANRDDLRRMLDDYTERRAGAKLAGDMEMRGVVARLTDAAWWRRALRRHVGRGVEQSARELGLVHRKAGLYCSDESVRWHTAQQARNRKALEGQEAVNQYGQAFGLDELADKGLAKASNRRADLMVRARGFDELAEDLEHEGLFITWTAPSAYHPRHTSGARNDRYQEGRTPRDAHQLICKQWAKARAVLDRIGIRPYGFRVVEPHHDGTPHWHMLLFVAKRWAKKLCDVLSRYAWEPNPEEMTTPTARHARFAVKRIDRARGSAAGYIAKYIAKNIDGAGENDLSIGADHEAAGDVSVMDTAKRVRAWASRWGIRQFQQIGGPQVTGYRELRRVREMGDEQGELFDVWRSADSAEWCNYIKRNGGIDCRRDARPVQIWREVPDRKNRYGEQAAPEILGIEWRGAGVVTREYVWEVRAKGGRDGRGVVGGREARCRNGSRDGGLGKGCAGQHSSVATGGFSAEREEVGDVGNKGGNRRFEGLAGGVAASPWTRVNNCTGCMNEQYRTGCGSGRKGGGAVGASPGARQIDGGGIHAADSGGDARAGGGT